VNLIAAKSVDGRVNEVVTSSAVIGFESPRQRPRSSLDTGCLPRQLCGRRMTLAVRQHLVRRREGRTIAIDYTHLTEQPCHAELGRVNTFLYFANCPQLFFGSLSIRSGGHSFPFARVKWPGRELTINHHLRSRLRISGAIPLLSLCAFKGKMLPFTFTSHVEIMSRYYAIFSRSDSDLEVETENLKLCAA
jgi:hypothetical protein